MEVAGIEELNKETGVEIDIREIVKNRCQIIRKAQGQVHAREPPRENG